MKVCIIDTETTGTDEAAVCIEVAAARYDLTYGLEDCFSSLVQAEDNPAFEVNGIPAELLYDAAPPSSVWLAADRLARGCACVVAHNAEFDRRFAPPLGRYLPDDSPLPWVCSMDDIDWPHRSGSKSLAGLCLAHNVGVEAAHRAIADVMLLVRLFDRMREQGRDVRAMIERAMRPKALFVVAERKFDKARNALAKGAGFRWDQPCAPGQWSRKMFLDLAEGLPFAVERVGE